ncbi:MAG: AMP-binding protein [Deltaproteobacteria bacterium]|nr:AMP-binding protein [Deltaproteobacteria bacterium]
MNRETEKNVIQRLAVGDGFRRSASRFPHKFALIERRGTHDEKITYRDLNGQLNRFARAMRKLGLSKGDRVACMGPNSIEFAVVLYGTPKGGFTFVPVNFFIPPEGIVHILDSANVKVFIFDDALLPVVSQVIEKKPKTVQHYVIMPVTGAQLPEKNIFIDFNEMLREQSAEEPEDVIIWERDIAEISFTSGATAAPKGAMISHLSTCVATLQTLIEMAPHLNEKTMTGCMLPIFHCGARTFVTSSLHIGCTTVLFRSFDVLEVLQAIEREKITLLGGLPMMWRTLFSHPDIGKYDTSSVVSGIYGMAPMDETTKNALIRERGIALYLNSGQTEFFPPTNYCKPEWQLERQGNYWGTPGLLVDGGIMDDKGTLLPPGEIGEIVWRGPACMEEYLNNPKATEEARQFGWHHSGDLGFIDEDGLLKFVDRKKDIIKSGGENVSSIKVEETILNDARVAAVAIIGLPHERWGEAVTAIVMPRSPGALTEDDVIQLCRKSLAAFEIPKKVVFTNSLPTTSTGKLRKNILRETYEDLYRQS